MSHIRILLVGPKRNLDQIYDDCPDSSSESCAEMAFGYDSLSTDHYWASEEFTRANEELYNQIIEGRWWECLDIRDTAYYGDYACINGVEYETGQWNDRDIRLRNQKNVIEHIKHLPSDTIFFFADAHL